MAREYKNFGGPIVTGGTTVYSCPENKTAILIHLQCANVDGSASADVTAHWTDYSDSAAVKRYGNTIAVPADTAVGLITGTPVLESQDTLMCTASADGDLEVSGSVLEIS
jgi:hypothetical protein